MATQARYHGAFPEVSPGAERAAGTRGVQGEIHRLRRLPNEDVYFFRKAIDNSRIVRQADPRGRARCWRLIGTAAAVTFVLFALLWPGINEMLTGYELENLKQQQQKLLAVRAALEVDEARLLSPERLEELARIQEFIDPAPKQVVYLNPKADGSLAFKLDSKR